MPIEVDKILGKPLLHEHRVRELTSDPSSPRAGEVWVKSTISGGSGGGIYKATLGLGFPYLSKSSGGSSTYQFSFRTLAGTTKRVTLT